MVRKGSESFIGAHRIVATPGPSWLREAGAHDHHEFILVVRGRYTCRCGARRVAGGAGAVFFYPAGLAHHPAHKRDGSVELLLITLPRSRRLDLPRQVQDTRARLRTLATWMLDQRGRCLQRCADLFVEEYRAAATERPPRDLVDDAIARMHEMCELGRGIDHCCSLLGVSRPTLYRAFKARLGVSPQQHYQRLRAERARLLVEQQGWSLQRAAAAVGLSTGKSLRRLLDAWP